MTKGILFSAIICIASLAFVIIACQKSADVPGSSEFDVAAAKEWYYGVFKKSAAYNEYNRGTGGKKLPAWSKGIYKKIGGLEIVEFPLAKEKKSVLLDGENGLSAADNLRIAEASLSRIVIIKTPGNRIVIREIDYIPEWNYLKMKNFDISHNSMTAMDKNYSGKLIVKKWNGEELSRKIIAGGKTVSKGRIQRAMPNNARSLDCATYLVTEYQMHCIWVTYGDEPATEECDWIPTGVTWYEEICDDDPSCGIGMSSEECACQMYELGCEGGGDGGGDGDTGGGYEIINKVDDPCLKDMVEESIDQDCRNKVSTIINTLFAASETHHLYFEDNPTLAPPLENADARTQVDLHNMSLPNRLKIEITFNTSQLDSASQEYIAATIFHEAIHAWIDYSFPVPTEAAQHHESMAQSGNIQMVANAIREIYPNLSMQDAIDLSWGGLQNTIAWTNLTPQERDRINQVNNAHKFGTSGTPCSP